MASFESAQEQVSTGKHGQVAALGRAGGGARLLAGPDSTEHLVSLLRVGESEEQARLLFRDGRRDKAG